MTDETPDQPPLAPDGGLYRVKARHPRRDGPLVITDAAGAVIAESGQTCDGCTVAQLESMIRNGYVERIDEAAPESVAPPALPMSAPVAPPRRRAGEV